MNDDTAPKNRFNEHLANERTFLAWIRTSIGIMAFGFVVEKFGLFMKKLSLILLSHPPSDISLTQPQIAQSSSLGILLIALGTLISVFAFIKYKWVDRQIQKDQYQPFFLLEVMLSLSILAIGICLVIYLVPSI